MDLSIVTVNTNDKNILRQIKSVIESTKNIEFEQIVSDNGSTDNSLEEIRSKFPEVKIVENKKNIGFGKANNSGVNISTGKYVLLLNPDMEVQSGSLEKIVKWMDDHKDVGLVSCKLVDSEGKFSKNAAPRRFPKLVDQLAILLKLPHVLPKIVNKYLLTDFDETQEQEVDSVRGSFMLLRKEIIAKLGWAFDPRYFIWFEDVDTCREVKKLGYKVMYTPIISCVDLIGQTFKKQPTYQKQVWFTGSMLKYFKKWEPWYKWMWIAIFRPVALLLTLVVGKFKK